MLTQQTPRAAGKAIITGIDTIGIANITLREELLRFLGSARNVSPQVLCCLEPKITRCANQNEISQQDNLNLVGPVTFFVFFQQDLFNSYRAQCLLNLSAHALRYLKAETKARNRKQKQTPVVNYCFLICLAMNELHFFPSSCETSWYRRSGTTTYAGNPC